MALVIKNPPVNARDRGVWDPWVEKMPGGGNSNLLHYSCLGNPMGHKELDLTEYTCNQVLFDIHNLDVAQASQA